jgi:ligand-binding sensor domain-containing protein/serine phosphatase RsbU (regulator of sigma subunit)
LFFFTHVFAKLNRLPLFVWLLLSYATIATSLAQKVAFRSYGLDEGLPQLSVTSLHQDSRGYLWVGTQAGLSRFDGKDFAPFTAKDGLKGKYINYSYEDLDKRLWVITDEGLNVYDGTSFTSPAQTEEINKQGPILMAEGAKGKYLILTQSSLVWFDGKKILNTWDSLAGFMPKDVQDLYRDKDGTIWVSTVRGLYRWDGNKFTLATFGGKTITEPVYCVLRDSKGRLWFEGKSTLSYFANGAVQTEELPGQAKIEGHHALVEDLQGRIWMNLDNGLARRDRMGIMLYGIKEGLPDINLGDVCVTNQGQVFIGTYNKGLCKYENSAFEVFEPPTENRNILALTTDTKQVLWLNIGNEIWKFDGSKYAKLGFGANLEQILSLAVDQDDNLWIGSTKGVFKLKNGGLQPQNDIHGYATAMHLASNGDLIIGSYGEGLFRYQGGKLEFIAGSDKLNQDLFISIVRDAQGHLWLGTMASGLIYFAGGKPTYYTTKEGLLNNRITQLALTKSGDLWIGTPLGLSHFLKGGAKGKQFENFTERNGLRSSNIWLVTEDFSGNLWLGHNKGIERFDTKTKKTRSYGKREGFLPIETTARGAIVTADKHIWYATVDGLVRYNPAEDRANGFAPITLLEDIRLFNQHQDEWGDLAEGFDKYWGLPINLVLPYDKNFLTFKVAGIHFSVPEQVQYQYMLEGLDKEWQPMTSQNIVTYSNLDPGTYTLMVRACNNEGLWNTEPTKYTFTITPPFWKRWWFYLIYPLLLFAFIRGFVSYRTGALERRKKELEDEVNRKTAQIKEELAKNEVLNAELFEKNQDIMDSIEYARRLQGVLLPDLVALANLLPESFVLYRPKDIVSGDFYWYHQQDEYLYLAAVDCTGHGVPGAFMSVLGNNLLNQIMNQYPQLQPEKVMELMNVRVMEALKQYEQGSTAKDGMEIAMARINLNTLEMIFCGANRPLYVLHNGVLEEMKGTKLPIGGGQYGDAAFTSSYFSLVPGDSFYLSSDGFADQFGGPKGRKYMTARLKEFLASIQPLTMDQQRQRITDEFETWRGEYAQMDDILIIGVRIPRV